MAPVANGSMKAIGPSAFAADLERLGIDLRKPPALVTLSPDVVRKLMPTFSKSLGVRCDFCHDNDNFKAWTPRKRVASKMWNEFVAKASLDGTGGGALYCDSCHGGRAAFLDRHDKKALSTWMDANYVSKLKRFDKRDSGCEGCHGDPFAPRFLEAWRKPT